MVTEGCRIFFFSINNDMLELDYDLLISRRKRLEKL